MNYNKINIKGKKAIFVDVDGTLGDTMSSHDKAYELAFSLNNVPFDIETHKLYSPYGGEVLMDATVIKKGYSREIANNIVRDKQSLLPICLNKLMRPNTKLVNFLMSLPSEDIEIIVVSNGRRRSVVEVLEKLGLRYYVSAIVCKEHYLKAKPSPDPYLMALKLVGVKPEEVIVLEDNTIGIDSALAAGIKDIIRVNTEDFSYEKI